MKRKIPVIQMFGGFFSGTNTVLFFGAVHLRGTNLFCWGTFVKREQTVHCCYDYGHDYDNNNNYYYCPCFESSLSSRKS